MKTITIDAAALQLLDYARLAENGEEIVLTQAGAPIARLVPISGIAPLRRPGSAKGIILHIEDDFDEIPEGF